MTDAERIELLRSSLERAKYELQRGDLGFVEHVINKALAATAPEEEKPVWPEDIGCFDVSRFLDVVENVSVMHLGIKAANWPAFAAELRRRWAKFDGLLAALKLARNSCLNLDEIDNAIRDAESEVV